MRLLVRIGLGALLLASGRLQAQAKMPVTFARWTAATLAGAGGMPGASFPDSIRQPVGYQHWKGAAIGGAVGGLAVLLLGLAAGRSCDDCTDAGSDWIWQSSLVGAGGGGALGFLIGLASPKYQWVSVTSGQ